MAPQWEIESVPIDDLLADLGYHSTESRQAARAAIEAARLTNSRKQRIAVSKLDAVRRCSQSGS